MNNSYEPPGIIDTSISVMEILNSSKTLDMNFLDDTANVAAQLLAIEVLESVLDKCFNLERQSPTSTAPEYSLVRFKQDGVFYVSETTNLVHRKRPNQTKIVTFTKYTDEVYYECTVLTQSHCVKDLNVEANAANRRRIKKITNVRKSRGDSDYCLIQYSVTKDFDLISSHDTLEFDGTFYVKCSDNVNRPMVKIATATEKKSLLKRLEDIKEYSELCTPQKKLRRNPILLHTPRVCIEDPLIKCSTSPTTSRRTPTVVTKYDASPRTKARTCLFQEDICEEDGKDQMELASRLTDLSDPFSTDDEDDDFVLPEVPSSSSESESDFSLETTCKKQKLQKPYITATEYELRGQANIPPTSVVATSSVAANSANPFDPIITAEDAVATIDILPPTPTPCDADSHINMWSMNARRRVAVKYHGSPAGSSSSLSLESMSAPSDGTDFTNDSEQRNGPPVLKRACKRNAHACFICGQLRSRLTRHFRAKHRNNDRVMEVLALENEQQRKPQWKKLRLYGTYMHNSKVKQLGSGTFLVQRRCTDQSQVRIPADYLPCRSCKGYFRRSSLNKHSRRCNVTHRKYERVQALSSSAMSNELVLTKMLRPGMRILLKRVLPRMNVDTIGQAARNDELIMKWGANYCSRQLQEEDRGHLIRVASQNMRKLGRLVLALKEQYGEGVQLKDFVAPSRFDDLLEAACKAGGSEDGVFKSASVPITIGALLKGCAEIIHGEASRCRNHELREDMITFLDLYAREWKYVSLRAHAQLKKNRFAKRDAKLLPLAEDIMKFFSFLKSEEAKLYKQLSKNYSYQDWMAFNKVLMCSLIVFNRKRVGDTQKITLENYGNKCDARPDSAIYQSLPREEQLTASSFMHMYVHGKKDSRVPVMIAKSQIPSFDLLIELRAMAGVNSDNIYLFARSGDYALPYFDGCEALRVLSIKSGVVNHGALRSTALRKHIATMSQVLNMAQGDLDLLAGYMGHRIDVHRQFYRLPEEALHLAKISKLLMAVSQNQIESLRGKSIDELPAPNETTTVDFLIPVESDGEEDGVDDIEQDGQEQVGELSNTATTLPKLPNKCKTKKKPKSLEENEVAGTIIQKEPLIVASKSRVTVQKWSDAERAAVRRHLSHCIELCQAPNQKEILACQKAEPILRNRTWRNIKYFVRNCYAKELRNRKERK